MGGMFMAVLQLVGVAAGLMFILQGRKAFISGRYASDEAEGPRYAQGKFHFISPKAAAAGTILLGVLLILVSAVRIFQIVQGAY